MFPSLCSNTAARHMTCLRRFLGFAQPAYTLIDPSPVVSFLICNSVYLCNSMCLSPLPFFFLLFYTFSPSVLMFLATFRASKRYGKWMLKGSQRCLKVAMGNFCTLSERTKQEQELCRTSGCPFSPSRSWLRGTESRES